MTEPTQRPGPKQIPRASPTRLDRGRTWFKNNSLFVGIGLFLSVLITLGSAAGAVGELRALWGEVFSSADSAQNEREAQADRAALLQQLGRSTNLSDLDLQGKDLSNAYLKGKDLSGANLSQTSMANASLQDSKLVGANLSGASLDRANLQRADMRYADLSGASLVHAKLNGVNLDAATLTPGVDLTRADLSNASARADLRLAVLADAKLVGTRLAPAKLQGADLTGADLQFADLRGADLRGANLRYAINLDRAKDFSLVRFDGGTQWPLTFAWPPMTDIRPKCSKTICALLVNTLPVNDFPPELTAMRKRLAKAAAGPECLPGWSVDARPFEIEAYAPRHRASFHVSTSELPGITAKTWAQTYVLDNVSPIPAITADFAAKRPAYAVRSAGVENGQPLERVHVWFIRGGRGFHLWGSASPALFSLFERDFIRVFRALGVKGDLFPSLRGDKDGCRP